MRRLSCAAVLLALLWILALPVLAEEVPTVHTEIESISKHGNLVLGITATELLRLGYRYGDVLDVRIGNFAIMGPLCTNYTDVEAGHVLVRACLEKDQEMDEVVVAISSGDMAGTLQLGVKEEIPDPPGYRWDTDLASYPVTLALQSKGGYLEEYELRRMLNFSIHREDYPEETDDEFANFRLVNGSRMGEMLYRSSSPINSRYGRGKFADEAARRVGIRTWINLVDAESELESYPLYADSYIRSCDRICLNMGLGTENEEWHGKVAQGIRFMLEHEGPYLVSCTMGKDRTDFFVAIVQAVCGCNLDEMVEEFTLSYVNMYGVTPDEERYRILIDDIFLLVLGNAFGVEDLRTTPIPLEELARMYLLEAGVSDEEIARLRGLMERK